MRASWRAIRVFPLAAGLLLASSASAEHTRFWRQTDYSEFEKGTPKGVAIRSDGMLMPAPRFAQFSDPNLAYLWALRVDSKGRLYAAGGSNAKVVRFDDAGKTTTVFESREMAAQALAVDSRDNLYVGTSPDGKIYKVTPDGKSSVFFEPKTKYIWALAFDSGGILFVGTGDDGKIFAVDPEGKGRVFYKSDEAHARSLAFDAKGRLLLGTDPSGLIVRVDILRKGSTVEAGAPFVLYETSKKEVTALTVDPAGNIYAAAIGEKIPRPTSVTSNPTTPAAPPANLQAQAAAPPGQGPQAAANFVPFLSTSGGAEVYRIATDGSPESLWTSHDDLVYSLGFSSSGKLLLGTGNRGLLVELEGHGVFSSLAKTASSQVTGIAAGPAGKVFVATANPGKILALGPGYEAEASFESQPLDAKVFSQWGRLSWWGENGATDGGIELYARSGNTSNPQNNWSAWAGPYTEAMGSTVQCPPARFVQWKVVFKSATAEPPTISWVRLAYLPKNVAPVIEGILVEDPGVRAMGPAVMPQQIPTPVVPVPLRLPQTSSPSPFTGSAAAATVQESPQRPRPQMPTQGFAQKGYQTVVWAAQDENDDDLLFAIYYRGDGEKNWRLLKDKIDQRFYSWDTSTMPDGAYTLKIIASDAASNPPDEALTTERQSDRFLVDNTPPLVENLRADTTGGKIRVYFEARHSSIAIARAEYSVDSGDWAVVFPIGRLTDARQENYEIELRELSPGEHTLAVQVHDHFDNVTSAKVTFSVAAHSPR